MRKSRERPTSPKRKIARRRRTVWATETKSTFDLISPCPSLAMEFGIPQGSKVGAFALCCIASQYPVWVKGAHRKWTNQLNGWQLASHLPSPNQVHASFNQAWKLLHHKCWRCVGCNLDSAKTPYHRPKAEASPFTRLLYTQYGF